MSTDELDLDALRKVAEGATEGPWLMDDTYATVTAAPFTSAREAYDRDRAVDGSDCWVVPESMDSGVADHNLAHIAAFDPPTVIALLDEVESLRADRDAWRGQVVHVRGQQMRAIREADALEAKVARVEALVNEADAWAREVGAPVGSVDADDLRHALEDAPDAHSAPETGQQASGGVVGRQGGEGL